MSGSFLFDSFQLIIAVYLFYIALRGDGSMYHFSNLTEEQVDRIRTPLRIWYAVAGIFAAADFAFSALRTSMFVETTGTDGAVTLTQKFTVDPLPFLNDYNFLTTASTVCTILLVITLFGLVFWLIRTGKKKQ